MMTLPMPSSSVDGKKMMPSSNSPSGPNPNSPFRLGQALLRELQDAEGDADTAIKLIALGADANAEDMHGMSCLALAARRGWADVSAALLQSGAKVDWRNQDGWTPLLWAVTNGHQPVAEILLKFKADVNAQNENSDTPLIMATLIDEEPLRLPMAKLLLQHGADVTIEGKNGQRAHESAIEQRDEAMVKLLQPLFDRTQPATTRGAILSATTLEKDLRPLKPVKFKPPGL